MKTESRPVGMNSQAYFGDGMKLLHAFVMTICASLAGGLAAADESTRLESPVAKSEG